MSHVPERMCISCRIKKEKEHFFRIVKNNTNYVLDLEQKAQSRGIYVCKDRLCIEKLSKNKKYNVDLKVLSEILKLLKKSNKNILPILKGMRNSPFFIFGTEMITKALEKKAVFLIFISEDSSLKIKEKLINKAIQNNIPYFCFGTKFDFGEIIGKEEVNVLGINDKESARGLLKRLGGGNFEST